VGTTPTTPQVVAVLCEIRDHLRRDGQRYQQGPSQRQPKWGEELGFAKESSAYPYGFYVDADDSLAFSVKSVQGSAGGPITFAARIQLADGRITAQRVQILPAANGSAVTATMNLYEGWLIGVTAMNPSASVVRGMTYCVAQLQRRAGPDVTAAQVLLGDYLASGATVMGAPGAEVRDSIDGPGANLTVVNSAPGAGNNFTYTVPANLTQRLRTLAVSLTTSATVASRQMVLTITDGVNTLWKESCLATQAASLTYAYQYAERYSPTTSALTNLTLDCSLPEFVLRPGYTVGSSLGSIQAGDAFTSQILAVEQWISP
jgi:hypothetical protein